VTLGSMPPDLHGSHLLQPLLGLQDVSLHLVSIGLHAGDEHSQFLGGSPAGGGGQCSMREMSPPEKAPALHSQPICPEASVQGLGDSDPQLQGWTQRFPVPSPHHMRIQKVRVPGPYGAGEP
jgi:hypothetical protein